MPSEAVQVFEEAFNYALELDGSTHMFAFTDGYDPNGRLQALITVLWIKNVSVDFHLHTHGLNTVLRRDERHFVMQACMIPDKARIYTGDYVDIDNQSFKITSSRIKDGLWNVVAEVLGSA